MLFNFSNENVLGVQKRKRETSRCQESVTYAEFGMLRVGNL